MNGESPRIENQPEPRASDESGPPVGTDVYPLIAAEDPPPVQIVHREARNPVLFVADHASNRIPRALEGLGLEAAQLDRHIAYDIGAAALTERLARLFDAPAVLAGYSRLLVDLNRSLEDPTAFPEVSDGIVIPGNARLSPDDKTARVRSFYTPYRAAIDHMLERLTSQPSVPALISIHSFTPELNGLRRPWQLGLLWDKDPRIPLPLLRNLRAHPGGLEVGDNEPYSGKHPADYTIDHHAEARGLPHVSIEVRQDLIADEVGVERWSRILYDALEPILNDSSLYRLR